MIYEVTNKTVWLLLGDCSWSFKSENSTDFSYISTPFQLKLLSQLKKNLWSSTLKFNNQFFFQYSTIILSRVTSWRERFQIAGSRNNRGRFHWFDCSFCNTVGPARVQNHFFFWSMSKRLDYKRYTCIVAIAKQRPEITYISAQIICQSDFTSQWVVRQDCKIDARL